MKHFLLFVLAFVSLGGTVNAQQLDSLQNQVVKLMKYYETYDNGSPESLKKANYKNAVKDITNGSATQKEINDSYKIVDWYIKGDKAIGSDTGKPKPDKKDFDEYIKNTDKAKAGISYLNQQKGMFQKMSYSQFEAFAEKANPIVNKNDIKKAFNEIHKNDGNQVTISSSDDEMTEIQKQMWAIDILQKPKNYEEFRKACKILNPNITDSEIRKTWEKHNK